MSALKVLCGRRYMVRQLTFDLDVDRSFRADDFLPDHSNQSAYDHLTKDVTWAGPFVVMVGPAQSGKSHLAHIWAEREQAIFVAPDDLGAAVDCDADVQRCFVLEDVDRAPYDESGLFHFLNECMRTGARVLMTARQPISAWPYVTNDVKSRARLGTFLELSAPSDTLLSQLLVKHLSDRQVEVDLKVVNYLVPRMERSALAAARLVEDLDMLSLQLGKPITRSMASDLLVQVDAEQDRLTMGRGDETI